MAHARTASASKQPKRVCLLSVHTSPLEQPGTGDAGGMNVVVLEQSLALARRGHEVDLFTRRRDPDAPAVVEVAAGVRLHHLDAGPAAPLAKSAMEQAIPPFRETLQAALRAGGHDLVHSHPAASRGSRCFFARGTAASGRWGSAPP